MKKYNYIVLIAVLMLFTNGSCKDQEGQHFITIQNNSDKEIIFLGSLYTSIAQDSMCFKPMTKIEYGNFIYFRLIKPSSSKKVEVDLLVKEMQTNPNSIWSLGIFNRADVDTMSCEEFEQKYPLKKEWKVTLADMQARNWVFVYIPETQGIE